MAYRLGLDTGGTFTDAALIDERQQIVATAKALTSHDNLLQGLGEATDRVLDGLAAEVSLVAVSTTLATNALVEGRGRPVGLILIGLGADHLERAGLRQALGDDPCVFVAGGHGAGGLAREDLDSAAIERFVSDVDARVDAFAISAMFAVRNPAHELAAATIVQRLSGKPVSQGHTLSAGLDAPRRALTALLNARLIPMLSALVDAARVLLSTRGIDAPLMVVKADGSLVGADIAQRRPVETILSGPAASVIGARFLYRRQHPESTVETDEMLVADMGGTTTDIALLDRGEPRLSDDGATVGGWRTMVRAVDIRTFGLGGDSQVVPDSRTGGFVFGPARVLPLCRLVDRHPELRATLERQLAAETPSIHSGRFVLVDSRLPKGSQRRDDASLSRQQRRLMSRIERGPVDLQSLFADQSLSTPLARLIQRGEVQLAAFTPTDACHVTGDQQRWDADAARLGALLLQRAMERESSPTPAAGRDDKQRARALARAVIAAVSRRAARVMLDSVLSGTGDEAVFPVSGPGRDQERLLERLFAPVDRAGRDPAMVSLSVALAVPIVAIGAPADRYFGVAGELLGTRAIVPEHADVANAVGAVVGVVRQQSEIVITALAGERVRAHYPSGPVTYDSLEEAAAVASRRALEDAEMMAKKGGSSEACSTVSRVDNVVEEGGVSVFFESRIVATAIGRPDSSIRYDALQDL